MVISGTKGAVSFPSLTVWGGADSWFELPMAHPQEVAENVPLVAQLENFAAVVAGQAQPLVSAADARETLAITLEIEKAVFPVGETGAAPQKMGALT